MTPDDAETVAVALINIPYQIDAALTNIALVQQLGATDAPTMTAITAILTDLAARVTALQG